ncbi:MAG: hypothetical protein JSW60_06700 [Thermoplasmatales archaeon]|nr:MAG: hypothetical protein JSW60_06700 [Thermoplasmatales archaeon]
MTLVKATKKQLKELLEAIPQWLECAEEGVDFVLYDSNYPEIVSYVYLEED